MLKALLVYLVQWYMSFFEVDRYEVETIARITTDGQGQRRGEQRTTKKAHGDKLCLSLVSIQYTTGTRHTTDGRQAHGRHTSG